VLSDPDAPAAEVLLGIADRLTVRSRGLVGLSLAVSPAGR
jgi:ATP-binding protein involved in chromosome partitioning